MQDVRDAFASNDASYYSSLSRDHFFQTYQAYSVFKTAVQSNIDEVSKRLINVPEPNYEGKEVSYLKT